MGPDYVLEEAVMGLFDKKDENSSLFGRIGDTAQVYSRYGGAAADAFSATFGGNPSRLGSDIAKAEGRNAGFLFDPDDYFKR